jgi:hypothetical protein
MDTSSSLLLLVWLVPCLVGAIGVRVSAAPWSVSLLSACALAEAIGCFGGNAVIQMGVAIFGTLALFVILDLRHLYVRREVELEAQKSGVSLDDYLEKNPHLYAKVGMRRKPVESKEVDRPAKRRRFAFWKRSDRKGRRDAKGNTRFADGEVEALVEVIVAAERIVLEREASARGYWHGRGLSGEVQLYVPPGADAYPGRVVSAVRKPNGTLMVI